MPGQEGRRRRHARGRGQTEAIGVALVLAMTLVGATIALAFGAGGLDAARLDSQEGGIEHAMTQLDSRAAMVALGDSTDQRVPLAASGGGGYRVDSEAGWINVTHHNYSGSGDQEVLYNESLGALIYERDGTLIAYQGGGVWRARGDHSTMVSPPEFHYHGATLTLPVVRIAGNASAAGAGVTAEVNPASPTRRVFPNDSRQYPSGDLYVNPVREGNVTVTVRSEYYQAWATYFRTRTTGDVTVDHDGRIASVKLVSPGTAGDFEMPSDGNSIVLRGLGDGHPIDDFTVEIHPDDEDSADFSNLQWSLWAEQGSQQFEVHLRSGAENDDPETDDCTERYVQASVYYSESNGDPYHGWHDDTAYTTTCEDLDGDGTNETYLVANLTAMEQRTMTSLSSSQLMHFSTKGDTWSSSVTFDAHGDEVEWEDPGTTFADGADDDTTMYNLTNHYLSLMGPTVELTIEDKNSDTVDEDVSSGTIDYDSSSLSFITYLHVTENEVRIELR